MKQLPKNCYCSDFSVYPNNWSKSGASIKKDWYIQYYFHDPAFKNNPKYRYGKLCIVKGGVNRYTICIYKTVQLYSLHLCSIAAFRVFFGLKYKCYWYNMLFIIAQTLQEYNIYSTYKPFS